MIYVAMIFAGAFLINSVPHLVSGCQGRPFRTPATRFTHRKSSALGNAIWGVINLAAGVNLLLVGSGAQAAIFLKLNIGLVAALLFAVFLAHTFSGDHSEEDSSRQE
ncbi:MAG: hypothetical protein LBN10_04905 [Propionibacteriaceae bacterium]|jgi:hypothetical protein|nr:hypothetical protein [Propionibacteriaceae bacterium]